MFSRRKKEPKPKEPEPEPEPDCNVVIVYYPIVNKCKCGLGVRRGLNTATKNLAGSVIETLP